ncbi:MAG: S-layer homology domain-containing protein [Clostridia bacterium]|nr:S-layer homology domain-containing protein [Clostridia bacterium]
MASVVAVLGSAPPGVPAHLDLAVASPQVLVGGRVVVRPVFRDAYYVRTEAPGDVTWILPPGVQEEAPGVFRSRQPGTLRLRANAGPLAAEAEVKVVGPEAVARLVVTPSGGTPVRVEPGGRVTFEVRALDAEGRPIAFDPEQLQWTLEGAVGRWVEPGTLLAVQEGYAVGRVRVTLGAATAEVPLTVGSPPVFADLKGHWAAGSILRMAAAGVFRGFPDGTARPDAPVTRAEFTGLLVRQLGLTVREGAVPMTFTDAQAIPDWAYLEVWAAVAAGVVRGLGDGRFDPSGPVTREQAATMLARALWPEAVGGSAADPGGPAGDGKPTGDGKPADDGKPVDGDVGPIPPFGDWGQVSSWARSAVAEAVRRGVLMGYPDAVLRPGATLTRAEALVLLSRAGGRESAPGPAVGATAGPGTAAGPR